MSNTEIFLSVLSILLVIVQLPAWNMAIRMRIGLNTIVELKEDLAKYKIETRTKAKELEGKIEDAMKANYAHERRTSEVFSKINETMVKLNASVGHLNETMVRSEQYLGTMVNKLYLDFTEFKEHVNKALEK